MKTLILKHKMVLAVGLTLLLTAGCDGKRLAQLEESNRGLEKERESLVKQKEELTKQRENDAKKIASQQQKDLNEKLAKELENFRSKTSAALREVSSFLAILEENQDADRFSSQILRSKGELAKCRSEFPDCPVRSKLDQIMAHISRINEAHLEWKSKSTEISSGLEVKLNSINYEYRANMIGPNEWNGNIYLAKVNAIGERDRIATIRRESIQAEINGISLIKTYLEGLVASRQ